MEIIGQFETREGVVHLHFHEGGVPGDVNTWSPDFSAKEKIDVLKRLQEYLDEEIGKLDPCICKRELMVTRPNAECSVHGLPSIGVDPGKPGSDETHIAYFEAGKVVKSRRIEP